MGKRFHLRWKRSALDDVKALTKRVREQVNRLIQSLPDNPHPPGSGPLGHDFKGLHKLDSGDFRIIYMVQDRELVILVVMIGNLKDVYERLRRTLFGR